MPFKVAVTTAVVCTSMVPAVTGNVAARVPVATFTEVGTLRPELLEERSTERPPAGAAPESDSVQDPELAEGSETGEHDSELTAGPVASETLVVRICPLSTAVKTTV